MNKLGFYIENSTVPGLRDALRQVKPPTILFHAGDRTLLQEIRRDISPDSFIIGRFIVSKEEQEQWLDSSDPDAAGATYADRILNYDFQYATERVNGRLLVDAWMTLNEALRGPASFENYAVDDQFRRRAANLDRFQVAMRNRLLTKGIEAVAFNFGAGNYTRPEHYLDWFPRTLESYRYLGFHEYGWPTLDPRQGTATAALYYKACLDGFRQKYGAQHTAIITEAGLARMYKYPSGPGGDVGWLYPNDTISEGQYWESLQWYNAQLCQDSRVRGACLFQVGHAGKWTSFRHLGEDNQQHLITLISKIAGLRETTPAVTGKRMQLEDFPRPPDDNGRGVHWSGSVYHPKGSELDYWIAELQALRIKWVKLMDDSGGSSLELCRRLLAAGIMPVVRLFKERPNPAGVGGRGMEAARALIDAGVRYFETNNEPDLADEWDGPMPQDWLDVVVSNFISDADAILGMGGLLGFPAMGMPDNMAPIAKVVARGRRDLFERGCWVALHNYSLNRPPEYPDDPINREGQQLTQEEFDRLGPWAWSLQTLAEINTLRRNEKKPTQTALEAPGGFRGYELAGKRIFDALGFHVPVISTEGGPVVGAFWDRRYNKTVPEQQMEWQLEIVRRMQNNEAPAWYFTMCTWMIAANRLGDWNYSWEQMSWYTDAWNEQFDLKGRLPIVDALKALPSVSRLKPQGGCSLRGQVRRETGEPLGRVRLSLEQAGQPPQALTTEPGGTFSLEGLPAGVYTLSVVTGGPVASGIVLSEGESKTLEVVLRGAGSVSAISGQVLTAEGAPQAAAPATLQALTDRTAQIVGSVTAASDGRFIFEGLPSGTYRVQAGQGRSAALTLDGWSLYEIQVRLPAPPGFRYEVASTRATPDSTRRLHGRVLDDQGNGLNGIRVQMSWTGAPPSGGFPTTTSGQDPYKPAGNFEFIASPGDFKLSVVQGDWPSQTTPALNTSAAAGQPGNSFAWEVIFRRVPTVQAGSVVRGRITNPQPSATITLAGSALADGPRSTLLDSGGSFRFEGLPAGDDYTLTLAGVSPLGAPFALDGSNELVRDLALTAGLRGAVSRADAAIALTMLQPLQWQRTQPPAANGAFSFDSLPPGRYRLTIDGQEIVTIGLVEGQQMELPIIVLPQPGQRALRGEARRMSGAPIADARILLLQAGRAIGETSTDSEGAFAFARLNPGFYTVSLADATASSDVMLTPDADGRVTLIAADLVIPPAQKVFAEYILLERTSDARAAHVQLRLRLLQDYLTAHPTTAVGFAAEEAKLADRVIILGDASATSAAVEEQLRAAGCAVERVAGDLYAQAARLQ